MQYLIDGYNLLFALKVPGSDLHSQRHALISLIASYNSLVKLDITLVFDSQFQQGESTKNRASSIDIIYTSQGETADDFILKWVKGRKNPKEITLVTSDKRLACKARALLAKTEEVLLFFSFLKKKAAHSRLLPEKKVPPPKPPVKVQKEPTAPKKIPAENLDEYYYQQFMTSYLELEGKDAPLSIEGEKARWLRLFEKNS